MTDHMLEFVRKGGTYLWFLCLLIVFIKVIWNFGVPYAMLVEFVRGKQQSWSIFQFVEVLPLLVAIVISFLRRESGMLSPTNLAIWGFGAIFASYVHMFIVPGVCGILYRIIKWVRTVERNGNSMH